MEVGGGVGTGGAFYSLLTGRIEIRCTGTAVPEYPSLEYSIFQGGVVRTVPRPVLKKKTWPTGGI